MTLPASHCCRSAVSAVTRVAGLVAGRCEGAPDGVDHYRIDVVRLVAAAYTPLTFDEAYYWTWSKISRVDSTTSPASDGGSFRTLSR